MRLPRIALAGAVLLLVVPLAAQGQTEGLPPDWLELSSIEKTLFIMNSRMKGRDVYVERLKNLPPGFEFFDERGMWTDLEGCVPNCVVKKVEPIYGPDGLPVADPETDPWIPRYRVRTLSPTEVAVLAGTSPGSAMMEALGMGYMGIQMEFNKAVTGNIDPTGNLDRVDDFRVTGEYSEEPGKLDPWMDPFAMIYAGGAMIFDASEGVREAEESLANSAAQAQAEADRQASMMSQFEESGVEEVGGRRTIRYTAAALKMPVQEIDGQQFAMNSASIWVDPEELVFVKHRSEGTATVDGKSREFFVEVENSDFRNPPGCGEMYEPYRRVQRMGGMLDDAQRAEIQEARKQLEEFDRRMAEMPAAQRKMAEKMMGSQMDKMRSLADGGGLEHAQEIEEIICDPDLKALFGMPGMEGAMPDARLARIQRHLVTLGYEPGNTDGVLDSTTREAISQFQTEHELPVTGEPSAQLENVLAAEVENPDSN